MHNTIYKCSSFVYKHCNKVLTCRFVHTVSHGKYKHLKWRLLTHASSLLEPANLQWFMPARTLYYLENVVEKKVKNFPTMLETTQETIKEVCLSENPSSPEDWDSVKMEIMNSCFNLTDENFDSVLMQVLLEQQKLELAQSFMNYLNERKLKPNYVTLCKYMALCSQNASIVGQDVILETYENILSVLSTPVLDKKIVQFLVQGLCATDKWRKSFDYTKQLQKSMLTIETADAAARAALKNKEYTVAWDILTNWYRSGTSPGVAVFEEYMKFLIDLRVKDPIRASHCFTRLADYLQSRNLILKQKAVVYVNDYFNRTRRYSTTFAKVDRDGVCTACKNKLESCSLTQVEFSYLRDSFLKYSLKKSDIFINTTYSEFERYSKFIERFMPFDIVLDGLNIAIGVDGPRNLKTQALRLFQVVNHLAKSYNRILVLGRFHMKNYPRNIMRSIKDKSIVFYVSNTSQDDPYLVYAALASGPNTNLVSSDMMRDHISRLSDPKLIHLFKKWQQSHQVYLGNRCVEEEVVLMGPLKHNIAIQGSMEKGWHVPYDNEMKLEPYEELNNWLCVQKRA